MNKSKLLQIRVNDDFLSKIEYLQKINGCKTIAETVRRIIEKEFRKEKNHDWTPITEGLPPKGSYTETFWLTVKLDNGRFETLLGRWSSFTDEKGNQFDAFDCWKDTLINGHVYRLGSAMPMDKVIAWMPCPHKYYHL